MDCLWSIINTPQHIEKAYGINDFIERHEMTVDEINDALRDEFGVELYSDNGVAHIAELCEPNAKSSWCVHRLVVYHIII